MKVAVGALKTDSDRVDIVLVLSAEASGSLSTYSELRLLRAWFSLSTRISKRCTCVLQRVVRAGDYEEDSVQNLGDP